MQACSCVIYDFLLPSDLMISGFFKLYYYLVGIDTNYGAKTVIFFVCII
jgi:hypothetical protein